MFEESKENIFKLDLYFKENHYIKTYNKNNSCRFFQNCSKPSHLVIYFLEILVRIYFKNVNDISKSLI